MKAGKRVRSEERAEGGRRKVKQEGGEEGVQEVHIV